MTTIDEPMLDGMPEPPPAWVRPARGVRMSALHLLHQLAAALAHVGVDEELPALQTISLEVRDGHVRLLVEQHPEWADVFEPHGYDHDCANPDGSPPLGSS